MAFSYRKKLGLAGEHLACLKYLENGYILVTRNFYNHKGKQMGEIDLIMRNESDLVFIEVKTRTNNKFGSGAEAITRMKQKKMLRTINWFIRKYPIYTNFRPRIDVCIVEVFSGCDLQNNLDKSRTNVIIITDAVTKDY